MKFHEIFVVGLEFLKDLSALRYSNRYFCKILNRTWLFCRDFRKFLKYQISWNFFSSRSLVAPCGRTDMTKLTVTYRKLYEKRLEISGATALQGLGRQSGRRRLSAKLVPTFSDRVVSRGQRNGSPRPLISVYRTWIATYFIQVAPQLTSRGWVHPVPDPLPLRKSGSAWNRTRDLCICSQKPWPLDHRGGQPLGIK